MLWRDTIRVFGTDPGYNLLGNQNLSFVHFQVSISSHSNTTMVIAQTIDGGTFDMTCTPYHRSAGKQERDAIIGVGVSFACR